VKIVCVAGNRDPDRASSHRRRWHCRLVLLSAASPSRSGRVSRSLRPVSACVRRGGRHGGVGGGPARGRRRVPDGADRGRPSLPAAAALRRRAADRHRGRPGRRVRRLRPTALPTPSSRQGDGRCVSARLPFFSGILETWKCPGIRLRSVISQEKGGPKSGKSQGICVCSQRNLIVAAICR